MEPRDRKAIVARTLAVAAEVCLQMHHTFASEHSGYAAGAHKCSMRLREMAAESWPEGMTLTQRLGFVLRGFKDWERGKEYFDDIKEIVAIEAAAAGVELVGTDPVTVYKDLSIGVAIRDGKDVIQLRFDPVKLPSSHGVIYPVGKGRVE